MSRMKVYVSRSSFCPVGSCAHPSRVSSRQPNLRLLAPLLQQWVTEVCTLIDLMPQDPERRMFELPYRCNLDDLDLDVVRSAIDRESP